MRTLSRLLLLLALSLESYSAFAQGFELRVDERSIAGSEPHAHALIDAARVALPQAMKNAFPEAVLIRFRDLDGKGALTSEFCAQERIAGKVASDRSPYVIEINSAFLGDSLAVGCYEGSTDQIAIGAIIHELTHLYDALADRDNRRPVSERPRFLALTGWEPYPSSRPVLRNTHAPRSANPHEFLSPGESLAVNMEYFLLDPSFRCRRPALHEWYTMLLAHLPFPNQSCPSESRAFPLIHAASAEVVVDPARVAAIDLVVAGAGNDTFSNFGHAMLRLVVCAPERTEVSEACRSDKQFHIAVSPVGVGDGLHISTDAILAGEQRSYLVFLPYADVEKNYSREELRELRGYPLRLSDSEKTRLVEAAIERYWTYLGDYQLLSNNCADEIRILLQASLDRSIPLGASGVVTPKRLVRHLARETMLNEAGQYRTPSAAEKIDQELRRNFGQTPSAQTILSWTVRQRKDWGRAFVSGNPQNVEAILRDLLGIERVAYDQLMKKLGEKAANLWWESARSREAIMPRSVGGNRGYGIPLGEERPSRLNRATLGTELLEVAKGKDLLELREMQESWAWQIELVSMLPLKRDERK